MSSPRTTALRGSLLLPLLLLLLLPLPPPARSRRQAVEDVTKKQLEGLLDSEDYLAVFWCKHSSYF